MCIACESGDDIVSIKIPAVFRYLIMEMLAANAKVAFAVEAIGALNPAKLAALIGKANPDQDDAADDQEAENDDEEEEEEYGFDI